MTLGGAVAVGRGGAWRPSRKDLERGGCKQLGVLGWRPMSFNKAFCAILAVFCVFVAKPARAEEWTRKSFLMPKGSFELTGYPARPAMAEINASRNSFAKPVK